ncbi:imidazole glycerol phosphate synthase subunit HisH [Ruminococcaceae bacterium OttesenSCG-928-L11]|nr:imidazole glycerol phosphate synthase subunit HisH [Ruminococcaceae bacterium OttesenSCG-928-L11]
MIAIVDYGVGNLFSLRCSLEAIGAECVVTPDAGGIRNADKVILPGVGAFGDASRALADTGLGAVIQEEAHKGKPLMGICLGMQLLYEGSCEYGQHQGLGLVPGQIVSLSEALVGQDLKVPHMGWNSLDFHRKHPLLRRSREGDFVYYVHSFYAPVSEHTAASSQYGTVSVTGVCARDNVCGAQFHPEKSGEIGLNLLRAFLKME